MTMEGPAHTSAPAAEQRTPVSVGQAVKQIAAAIVGNTLEWYDWYIYSLLAVYFASQFFPSGSDSTLLPLLYALGVFAIGFFMRPIGGLLLGVIGDRYGRKVALQTTILMMGAGSVLVAISPTYEQAGVFGPIVFVVARLMQGLSAGGEYGAASAFLVESAPPGRRGLFSSFFYIGATAGNIAAVGSAALLTALLDDASMTSWGWRVPFVVGALASLTAAWIRRSAVETFAANEEPGTRSPGVFEFARTHPRQSIQVFGLMAAPAVAFYTWAVFLPTYAQLTVQFDKSASLLVGLISLVFFWLLVPVCGLASDRWGRKPMLLAFGIGSAVLTVPLLLAITDSFVTLLLVQCAGMVILACFMSIQSAVFSELFPARFRAVGVGFPYGVSVAIFGGTGPYLATWFIERGHPAYFGWFIVAVTVFSLIFYVTIPERARAELPA